MPKHHIDALSHALTQRGWTIVSTRSLDDFPCDAHAWTIERGHAQLEIQFDRFDAMGNDVPLHKSWGCAVHDHRDVSLSFGKPPGWAGELASFIAALDLLP
ncbi:hypothetical protein Poly51_40050 [Rubripirellula tenax]|uniref:Uncharacterized protein n=1 Tax=Rubripirellula tenax TaxID=2528015 RepID=A0A5C6ENT3_9BACT|nr:hypothetical protein [Rubripirellula tenax]TWU50712.1 hypothetical protein Poly51_40050 [Rubripirellula tenax]